METVIVIHRFMQGLQILMGILIFTELMCIRVTASPQKMMLQAYETICMQAREQQRGLFEYGRWEHYLKIHGATYHYGQWINPVSYIAVCIVTCLLAFAIGCNWSILIGIVIGVIGLFLPGLLLEYLNKKDNEKLLIELDLIYSALAIQIRAGVYITDALAECYGSVSHPRLRDALQTLSGEIVMKADLDEALERFQEQFNNSYIDSLCITILQAMESGQAVELLGDIAEQIKDMEILLQQKRKEQLNRSVTFYQLGIFALILVLVLYACFVHLFSAGLFF